MKENKIKFLKEGIFFTAVFMSIALILNLAYLKFIEPQRLIQKRDAIYRQFLQNSANRELDLAFFGDSHPDGDVDTSYIKNSFLFAQGGQSYVETYYELKKVLNDKVKIKNIVLQLDLHTFSAIPRSEDKLFRELYYYSQFIGIKDIAKLRKESLLSIFFQENIMFLGKGNELITNALIHLGLIPPTGSPKELSKNAKTAYAAHFGLNPTIEISEQTFDYFLNTLRLAKENGINIIFVKYPLSKQYELETEKYNLDKEGYYDKVFAEIDKVIGEHAVFDGYGIYFDNPEYFWDSEHLNALGSEVFSKKLNEYFSSK